MHGCFRDKGAALLLLYDFISDQPTIKKSQPFDQPQGCRPPRQMNRQSDQWNGSIIAYLDGAGKPVSDSCLHQIP